MHGSNQICTYIIRSFLTSFNMSTNEEIRKPVLYLLYCIVFISYKKWKKCVMNVLDITRKVFLFRKHYFRHKLLTLWKELPRYCSWLFTLEWQRGKGSRLYEAILFLFRERKRHIRRNWKCEIGQDFYDKFPRKIYWLNVNLLSQVLELDNHERNMWPISVINLKLKLFLGKFSQHFTEFAYSFDGRQQY